MRLFSLLTGAFMVATGLTILATSACGDDVVSPAKLTDIPTSGPTSTEIPDATPTPDPSFQPTVGMLASVPIGRMRMQCWFKEAELNERPFGTATCEGSDANRELYLEVWRWKDAPEEGTTASLIYFEETSSGSVNLMMCDGLVIKKETKEKVRGEPLEGTCSRYSRSLSEGLSSQFRQPLATGPPTPGWRSDIPTSVLSSSL